MERGYLFAFRAAQAGAACALQTRRGLTRGAACRLVRKMRQGNLRIWSIAVRSVRKVGAG